MGEVFGVMLPRGQRPCWSHRNLHSVRSPSHLWAGLVRSEPSLILKLASVTTSTVQGLTGSPRLPGSGTAILPTSPPPPTPPHSQALCSHLERTTLDAATWRVGLLRGPLSKQGSWESPPFIKLLLPRCSPACPYA